MCVNELSGWGQRLFFPALRGNSEGHAGSSMTPRFLIPASGAAGGKRLSANVSRAGGSAEAPGRNKEGGGGAAQGGDKKCGQGSFEVELLIFLALITPALDQVSRFIAMPG